MLQNTNLFLRLEIVQYKQEQNIFVECILSMWYVIVIKNILDYRHQLIGIIRNTYVTLIRGRANQSLIQNMLAVFRCEMGLLIQP